jgi:hypothetical protein
MSDRKMQSGLIVWINKAWSNQIFLKFVECDEFSGRKYQNSRKIDGRMIDDLRQIHEVGGGARFGIRFYRKKLTQSHVLEFQ